MSNPSSSMLSNLQNVQIHGGQYHQQIIYGQPVERPIDKIYRASAPSAIHTYEHGGLDQPKCHRGTREAIFKRLWNWLLGHIEQEVLMMWLYGAAGAGKSAIAYDFAERCAGKGLLFGDFFFSKSDPNRANIRSFVATIAIQGMRSHPSIRSNVEKVVCEDPGIFDTRFEHQLKRMITQPLRRGVTSSAPRLIIVDGLDECQDKAIQERIIISLLSLAQEMNRLSIPIRILIASRPEDHLITTFNSPTTYGFLSRIALNNDQTSWSEIRLFVTDKLQDIKSKYLIDIPPLWPGDDVIETLVRKASGQFIYAKLAVNFIIAGRLGPLRSLDIVLGLQAPPDSKDMPFAELDAMYHCILSQYGDIQMTKLVLGVRLITAPKIADQESMVVLMGSMKDSGLPSSRTLDTTAEIASFLNVKCAEVSFLVKRLSAVIEESDNGTLVVQHASLVDFIQDPSRSGNYYIDSGQHHALLAVICLQRAVEVFPNSKTGRPYRMLELVLRLAAPTAKLQHELHNFFDTVFFEKASSHFLEMIPIFILAKDIISPEDHRVLQATFDYFLDEELAPISSWSIYHRAYLICSLILGKFSGTLEGILPHTSDGLCETLRAFENPGSQAYIADFLCNRSKFKLPLLSSDIFTKASEMLLERFLSLPLHRYLAATDFVRLALFIRNSAPSDALAQKINHIPVYRTAGSDFIIAALKQNVRAAQSFVDYLRRCNVEPHKALDTLSKQADGM